MCGFIQVVERGRPCSRDALRQALPAIAHRGPDAQAMRVVDARLQTPRGEMRFGLGYAHQRLAILDLDPRSNQPFQRDGRTLVYNGEVYNFRDIRKSAALANVRFETTGDTEVLFEAVSRRGLDALNDMSGMWAFVLTDENTGELVAARDRYGKKPLFYYLDEERLVFSSTIRGLLAVTGHRPVMRPEVLQSYLAHGVVWPDGGARTHLQNIHQVPPGGAFRFDLQCWKGQSETWFDVEGFVRSAPADPADLPAIMREAVVSRLVSDRQVGLLLSGGVDSTLVLSVIHAAGLHEQVQCFIGETGRSDDALYAQQCIDQLGMKAITVNLGYDSTSFERFRTMCRHQEKPFPLLGNSMAMSEMYEAIAGYDIPVVLDGTGGDEIFGGYWDRHYPFAIRDALKRGDGAWLAQAARRNARLFWRITRDMLARPIAAARLDRRLVPASQFRCPPVLYAPSAASAIA